MGGKPWGNRQDSICEEFFAASWARQWSWQDRPFPAWLFMRHSRTWKTRGGGWRMMWMTARTQARTLQAMLWRMMKTAQTAMDLTRKVRKTARSRVTIRHSPVTVRATVALTKTAIWKTLTKRTPKTTIWKIPMQRLGMRTWKIPMRKMRQRKTTRRSSRKMMKRWVR